MYDRPMMKDEFAFYVFPINRFLLILSKLKFSIPAKAYVEELYNGTMLEY